MDKKNVAIIGAGAAGSYAAYLLKKEGFGVSVFEKSKGVGGRTASWRPTQNDSTQDECSLRINYGAQFFTQ